MKHRSKNRPADRTLSHMVSGTQLCEDLSPRATSVTAVRPGLAATWPRLQKTDWRKPLENCESDVQTRGGLTASHSAEGIPFLEWSPAWADQYRLKDGKNGG